MILVLFTISDTFPMSLRKEYFFVSPYNKCIKFFSRKLKGCSSKLILIVQLLVYFTTFNIILSDIVI